MVGLVWVTVKISVEIFLSCDAFVALMILNSRYMREIAFSLNIEPTAIRSEARKLQASTGDNCSMSNIDT